MVFKTSILAFKIYKMGPWRKNKIFHYFSGHVVSTKVVTKDDFFSMVFGQLLKELYSSSHYLNGVRVYQKLPINKSYYNWNCLALGSVPKIKFLFAVCNPLNGFYIHTSISILALEYQYSTKLLGGALMRWSYT